ncbi:pyruvate formate lyase activating enzyme [Clostridium algifaecis]|uniref:Pyruvate formate lyase activating enzyme n=1 Tax=Clostridium algifaecis TaxID=1472040 RepID=A0ABS4KWE1_9CLOT|nr:glycyl-radical enzyme activating protein [Clostridium algifaecis]MBP2033965.1 pyruvate formate lyase activating enzyme [Clostridium algifaecis]
MKNKALVFNIQRYSIYDGPGIRTIVFLKGCPLSCLWCSNPESQSINPQVIFSANKCINCGACVEKCNSGASILKDGKVQFQIEKCTSCAQCLDVCPTNARQIIGEIRTIDEVIREVEKDRQFYINSNGGVTFSGGEPTLHYEFLEEIVPKLKEKAIHVAIETTGYCEWTKFWRAVKDMDLILFDLKQMNNEKHKQYTGVENNIILQNAEKISKLKETVFRIPVIPEYNDNIENFREIINMIERIKFKGKVNLLPYHLYGKAKYNKIGKIYKLFDVETPSKEKMNKILNIFKKNNIDVISM